MSATIGTEDGLLKRFDDGEDVLDLFDLDHVEQPNKELKRVNVDFPS